MAGDWLTVQGARLSVPLCSAWFPDNLARTLLEEEAAEPIGLERVPNGAIHTPVCGECGPAGLSTIVESKVQTNLSCLVGSLLWKRIIPVALDGITEQWHRRPMPHCAQSAECPGQMDVLQAKHVWVAKAVHA